jgi:hypothetical protein
MTGRLAGVGRTEAWMLGALAAAALGIGMGLRAVARTREAAARIREVRQAQARVEEAGRDMGDHRQLARVLGEAAGTAQPLQALHRAVFPSRAPDIVIRDRIPTADGEIRRVEWLADAVPAEGVLSLIAAAESARPPWRLEALRLSALPDGPAGQVRAQAVFVGWGPETPGAR